MLAKEQKAAAKKFADKWKGKGYEKGDSQLFWIGLLTDVFGVANVGDYISFEDQVRLDHTSFIDARIKTTKVLIEQKSIDKDLRAPIKQSDGSLLSPFKQAKRYVTELPVSEHPRWIVCSNFKSFLVYDMERPDGEPEEILLENLPKEYNRLGFLVSDTEVHLQREMEVSIKAGELVGKIYDALLSEYLDKDAPETHRSINALCVRLVFCLYAEDAGVFPKHDMFCEFLQSYKTENVRTGLKELFKILDTPYAKRDPYEKPLLMAFPYVNGGLFADDSILIPPFSESTVNTLVNDCGYGFDWSGISPTIFGAVFESTLNPETRRQGGMHYTSIENIHKVIDPLFMDSLNTEYDALVSKNYNSFKARKQSLESFQDKLASYKFLDPACGSGNFLTESFMSLRRLENKVLRELNDGNGQIQIGGDFSPVKVNIHQFYGIEINDFAATVAKTALWISEAQMLQETEDIVGKTLDFLPLKSYANIVLGNALRIDWRTLKANESIGGLFSGTEKSDNEIHYDFIMGNPPFIGARLMTEFQKQDVVSIFGKDWKNVGNLDYVCCWYKKCADYMQDNKTLCALVSTNSVSQGEQVANLWEPLFNQDIQIDYAYRTFRWDSESNIKAHVHCVIIGFSNKSFTQATKRIYTGSHECDEVKNINAYLVDGENVFVCSRNKPICDVPEIGIGNKPIDDGNYLFSKEEMDEFVKKEPESKKYFKEWYGSWEFINRSPRYCLWLGDCSPAELRKMPKCLERVENVRNYRLNSPSAGTQKIADKPTRFHVENMPKSDYIVIPEVSSERRRYVPMGYMTPDILCSNKVRLLPNASLFVFAILTSSVHMGWMRTVCGRLKSDYDYSIKVVYNNFPWPKLDSESEIGKIIASKAQAILDARALYPNSSLADLYDERTMPVELRKAHKANDEVVLAAYGLKKDSTEAEIVAHLMRLYLQMTQGKSS